MNDSEAMNITEAGNAKPMMRYILVSWVETTIHETMASINVTQQVAVALNVAVSL